MVGYKWSVIKQKRRFFAPQALGHTVRLLPPSYMKAYVKRSKKWPTGGLRLAEHAEKRCRNLRSSHAAVDAICPDQVRRQQSGLMLHRSRQLLVCQRTMLSNAIRGHMAELGIISAKGRNGTAELLEIIADEQDGRIPAAARFSLEVLARQYSAVRVEIAAIEKRIHACWRRSCQQHAKS
jgi:transposase